MIRSVKLVNFRSHRATHIDFSEGIVALIGLNGSGKTSLFLAIGKCLFFYNPLTLHDLVMEGEQSAEITVEFISALDGKLCSVYNQFNAGKDSRSSFEATHEDGDFREGSEDVQQFIKAHLNIPSASQLSTIWSDSVGVEQAKFITPFETELTRRRKVFNDLLGITKYEKAYSNLSSTETELVTRSRILEAELRIMPSAAKLEEAKSMVQSRLKHGEELKKVLEQSKEELEGINLLLAEQELALVTQRQREELQGSLEALTEVLDVRDAISKLKPVTELQMALEEKILNQVLLVRSLDANTVAQVQMRKERITHLENTDCQCNLCGSELTPEVRQQRQKEALLEIENIKLERTSTLADLKIHLNDLKSELNDLGDPATELRILERKNSAPYGDIESEIKSLRKEIENLPQVEVIDLDIKEKRDTLIASIGSMTNELSGLRSSYGLAKKDLKEIVQQILEAEKKRADMIEIERKLSSLRQLRLGIRSIGPIVAENTIAIVSQKAQTYLSQMLPYSGMHIKWNSDYVVECKIDGQDRKFEKLSGGEKMVFALAIRLALVDHISGLGFVFLDEPTTHLDSDNRQYLAKCIRRIRGFTQLFAITHDDTFDDVCDQVVTLVKQYNVTSVE